MEWGKKRKRGLKKCVSTHVRLRKGMCSYIHNALAYPSMTVFSLLDNFLTIPVDTFANSIPIQYFHVPSLGDNICFVFKACSTHTTQLQRDSTPLCCPTYFHASEWGKKKARCKDRLLPMSIHFPLRISVPFTLDIPSTLAFEENGSNIAGLKNSWDY